MPAAQDLMELWFEIHMARKRVMVAQGTMAWRGVDVVFLTGGSGLTLALWHPFYRPMEDRFGARLMPWLAHHDAGEPHSIQRELLVQWKASSLCIQKQTSKSFMEKGGKKERKRTN
ncbi:IQ-domain [Musa troglodytarum]|uniref:IQ-domain n=1 Tax=Musa troglodytarum TaxID=320322 RepID=A0A9E7GNM6_9LILI|nr:IQ-domain [Musa troglodytarum]